MFRPYDLTLRKNSFKQKIERIRNILSRFDTNGRKRILVYLLILVLKATHNIFEF